MSDAHEQDPKPSLRERVQAQPRWKKIAVGVGVTLLIAGVAFSLMEGDAPSGGSGALSGSGGASFTGEGPELGGGAGKQASSENAWSGGFFKLGFSFFAGFSVGYAARAFLKIALIGCGIAFALLFVLQQADFVSVDWGKFDDLFSNLGGRLKGELERFQSFVTGTLPSAGLAGLGLVTGFKKS